jgi:hypothetical protein
MAPYLSLDFLSTTAGRRESIEAELSLKMFSDFNICCMTTTAPCHAQPNHALPVHAKPYPALIVYIILVL